MKRIALVLVTGLLLTSPSYGKDVAKKELKLGEKLAKAVDKCAGDPVCTAAAVQTYESKLAQLGLLCAASTNGSIMVVPGVTAGGGQDTIVELLNTSDNQRYALCFYVDAACNSTDFEVSLPPQAALQWAVSSGDTSAGIPASSSLPFSGELVCVEIDQGGFPVPGNALEASANSVGDADTCLNPISIPGYDSNQMDGTLCLGGGVTPQCPLGREYGACPVGIDPARIEGCWTQEPSFPPFFGAPLQFLCN